MDVRVCINNNMVHENEIAVIASEITSIQKLISLKNNE
jgi:hypothetical protein